jgi:MFS family permease
MSYRSLASSAGAGFLVLSFLARLPAAMAPLGLVILVVSSGRGYATAGFAGAAFGLGAAAGGPLLGWLTDRYGQRWVGLGAAVLDGGALLAALLAVRSAAAPVPICAAAALAGFAIPQVGPLVRVRWATLLGNCGRSRLLPVAMSYEGAVDEASYVAGPALVGLLALTGVPAAPLLAAAVLTLTAAVPFALHRTAPPALRVPVVPAPAQPVAGARLPRTAMAGLVVAMLAIGAVFGATATGATALAESAGRPGYGGLVYAVLGVGSALAGLATKWLPASFGLADRYLASAVALLVGTAGLLAVRSLAGAPPMMALLGATVAPYLVTGYALAERIAPPSRAGTAMTLLASGVTAGVAAGGALAGRLADASGFIGAYAVAVGAAGLAVVLALATRRALVRRVALGRTPTVPATAAAGVAARR